MNAEFISQPISGKFPEKHYGKITPFSKWVKFSNREGQEWVGSFEQSYIEEATFIMLIENTVKVFIVSCGQGYLIDINSQEQLNKSEISDIKKAIVYEQNESIFYTNGYNLCYIDKFGNDNVLNNGQIFDEIKLIEITQNKLYTKYWNYQTSNSPFHLEIDLTTNEINDSFYK